MFKTLLTIITISLTAVFNLQQIKINNYQQQIVTTNTILQEQSLPLAFQTGDFYPWNENNDPDNIKMAGIFSNSQTQSYLLNKNGTYNNLNLQINNFISFNDSWAIATLSNFHKKDESIFINNSFLMNKTLIIDDNATAIATNNHTFTKFGNNIISTDIGADLIDTTGKVIKLVADYKFGKGKTSFTAINDTFGVFVGGDQHCYILKNDGNIIPITNNQQPLIAPNPILLDHFVAINDNGGIIRDVNDQLFYLTINNNGNASTTVLSIDKTTPLFSTTTNFFTKTANNQGILNVSIENSSKFFGQPYNILVTTSNDIKFTPINEHYLHNFILLHEGLGVFINEQQIAYFVNETLTFTKITDNVINFQRINDKLGIITTNDNKLLISDSKNNDWSRINTINFSKTDDEQIANFINVNIDEGKTTSLNRTNSWITNNSLMLKVTNNDLTSITINDNLQLIPNNNNNITTIINNNANVNIKFKYGKTITYHVIIYRQDSLPTLENSINTNNKYVGIVNNNLYDINSTNTNDGFTINFNYETTIQFINIITIDSSNMNKINSWTIKPKTPFPLNGEENKTYLLQTVNWNNTSNWQYFTIYRNNSPIVEFWTTTAGIKLWNAALKMNYSANQLKNMNASQINNLKNLSSKWKLTASNDNILGYIITGSLIVSFIIAIAATIYDWYLKQQLKNGLFPTCTCGGDNEIEWVQQ